ncbi:MAG: glycosyltransferase family 4 protein [Phycisphaerales bacterium]
MPASILYLAPTFLTNRLHKQIRGVQVFDLAFAPDLARQGLRVVVPADRSWKPRLDEHFKGAPASLQVVYTPSLRKPLWNGLTLPLLIREKFDATFLGNPARGIFPGLSLLRLRGQTGRIVLQANRPPRPELERKLLAWNVTCTAVSEHVKAQFPASLRSRVSIYYGITGADAFHPPLAPPTVPDQFVRFCLIGKLDNAWKGADRAIAAFAALPADVRATARLHLASFEKRRPATTDPCIIFEPWRPADQVPAFLRSMHAMLVPSVGGEETFSQATVQAMLTGLPIVTSDLPVLAEKVRGTTGDAGFICAAEADFAHAITTLTRDAALRQRMGEIARATALARYVWSTPDFVSRFLTPSQREGAGGGRV